MATKTQALAKRSPRAVVQGGPRPQGGLREGKPPPRLPRRERGIGGSISWTGPTRKIPDLEFLTGDGYGRTPGDISRPAAVHAWTYACIRALSQNVASVPLQILGGPTSAPVNFAEHDVEMNPGTKLAQVFDRPNPYMTSFQLWEATVALMNLDGTAAWILNRSTVTEVPKDIVVVQAYCLKPRLTDDGESIVGWTYRSPGGSVQRELSLAQILMFKFFNPYDQVWGLAPLEAARRGVRVDVLAQAYSEDFFANNAEPAGVLTTERPLPRAKMDEILDFWENRHRGSGKGGKVGIVWGGVKWQPTASSQKDMQFVEQQKWNRDQILAVFKVPKTEISLYEDVNYACIPATERVYTTRGPVPICEVVPGETVWSFSETGPAAKKVIGSWKQGVKSILKIRTNNRKLRLSVDHPLLVLHEKQVRRQGGPYGPKFERGLGWREAREVRVGDLIVVAAKLPLQGKKELSDDLVQMAGAFLGDGSLLRKKDGRAQHISLALHSKDPWREKYAERMERIFSYARKFSDDRAMAVSRTRTDLRVGSRSACAVIEELDLAHTALEKRVPAWVWGLSAEKALLFLRGYLDTDGHVSKIGRITFATPNLKLVADVRALCHYLGLPASNINHCHQETNFGAVTNHRVCLSHPDKNRSIGSDDPRRLERLQAVRKTDTSDPYYWKKFKLPDGFTFQRVLAVDDDGAEEVFDLEIKDRHNFVCEGVVVHNTSLSQDRSFWQKTLVPIIRNLKAVLNSHLARWLRPVIDPQLRFDFDLATVPALQDDFSEKLKNADVLYRLGYPPNVINERLNLGLPELDWGDTVFVNSALVSVEVLAAGIVPPGAKPSHPAVGGEPGTVTEPKPASAGPAPTAASSRYPNTSFPLRRSIVSANHLVFPRLQTHAGPAVSTLKDIAERMRDEVRSHLRRLRAHQLGLLVRTGGVFDAEVWAKKLGERLLPLYDELAKVFGSAEVSPEELRLKSIDGAVHKTILGELAMSDSRPPIERARKVFAAASSRANLSRLCHLEMARLIRSHTEVARRIA